MAQRHKQSHDSATIGMVLEETHTGSSRPIVLDGEEPRR